MKFVRLFGIGLLFGITLYKAQIISWYRIYEMFRFESFHMYGIIGSAVLIGMVEVFLIKRTYMKDGYGNPISIDAKNKTIARYLIGGGFFGLGWGLSGACPGPMYILLVTGLPSIVVLLVFAVVGTFVYGVIRERLPH